jgi:hypothetical protein
MDFGGPIVLPERTFAEVKEYIVPHQFYIMSGNLMKNVDCLFTCS